MRETSFFRSTIAQPRDKFKKLLGIVGFSNVVIEPGVLSHELIRRFVPRGDGNQSRPGTTVEYAKRPRDIVAVHARHSDVEQYNIRAKLPGHAEYLASAINTPRLMSLVL